MAIVLLSEVLFSTVIAVGIEGREMPSGEQQLQTHPLVNNFTALFTSGNHTLWNSEYDINNIQTLKGFVNCEN